MVYAPGRNPPKIKYLIVTACLLLAAILMFLGAFRYIKSVSLSDKPGSESKEEAPATGALIILKDGRDRQLFRREGDLLNEQDLIRKTRNRAQEVRVLREGGWQKAFVLSAKLPPDWDDAFEHVLILGDGPNGIDRLLSEFTDRNADGDQALRRAAIETSVGRVYLLRVPLHMLENRGTGKIDVVKVGQPGPEGPQAISRANAQLVLKRFYSRASSGEFR